MNVKTKRRLLTAIAASIVGLPGYWAHAAGDPPNPAPAAGPAAASPAPKAPAAAKSDTRYYARASKLIGGEVYNPQGEKLGKIEDLILDTRNQRVHYAILSFGGMMGIGDKLFAYPVEMLRRTGDNDNLILNVDKAKLEKAPGFESSKWPDWHKDTYRRGVDRYFNVDRGKGEVTLVRASKLIGLNVDDRDKHHAGEVEDVVVSLGDGHIPFVVIDFDKAWSPDDKLLPVSMASLRISTEGKDKAVLNETRERLDMKKGFDDDKWPDFNDPAYQRERPMLYHEGRKATSMR
jgi:sporulation protein YlmC with PRC-barrel domain